MGGSITHPLQNTGTLDLHVFFLSGPHTTKQRPLSALTSTKVFDTVVPRMFLINTNCLVLTV